LKLLLTCDLIFLTYSFGGLMRIKNNVILQSALLMLGFGVLIGVLFPFFSDVVLAMPKKFIRPHFLLYV